MKFYDEKNKRLVIFEQKTSPEYWDKHWRIDNFAEQVRAGKNNRFIKKFTAKFLPPKAKILEGGCGIGQNVYGLSCWGYDAYGVDSARETIEKIKRGFPILKISLQDVRKLNFPGNFFDGYWSLGVIEHFWNGYNEILEEMKRIIKPGGYLFLTFPYMCPLRKFKAKMGLYKKFRENSDGFYQFILDANKTIKDFEKHKFRLVLKYPHDATKGIKDEISWLKPILQKIYDSRNFIARGIKFLNSILFSKIAGHCILLIFQKYEK